MSAASVVGFNQGVGYNFSLSNFLRIIGLVTNKNITAPTIVRIVLLMVILLLAYMSKVEWQSLFLIATACIWIPDFSYTYTLTLYVPALVAYFNEENANKSKVDGILLAIIQSFLVMPLMPKVDSYLGIENVGLKMGWSTLVINIVIWLWKIVSRGVR